MGEVVVKIKLENYAIAEAVKTGLAKRDVPSIDVDAVVDTGARMLAIPEDLARALELTRVRQTNVIYADGTRAVRDIVGAITLTLGDRSATLDAIVLPKGAETLLGQVPLEVLDLLVDCNTQTLVRNPKSPDDKTLYTLY
jgi:clan AA aspartic protease